MRCCDDILFLNTPRSDGSGGPSGGEVGKGGCKGIFSADGKTGSDTDHIRFCDTALKKKSFRMVSMNLSSFERSDEVGTQGHYIGIRLQFYHAAPNPERVSSDWNSRS